MYLASLINKGRVAYTKGTTDPTALPAEIILRMATIDGAKSVLWDNEIGSLQVHKKVEFWMQMIVTFISLFHISLFISRLVLFG